MRRLALYALIFSLVLVFAPIVHAENDFEQPLPDAPTAHLQPISKSDWSLFAGDATARGLDVYSTHWMLVNGDREMFLPNAIAKHTPAMAAYSAGVVAADWYVMRFMERHHHPKLGHLLMAADAGQDGFWAIHNLFLKPVVTK